MCVCAALPDLLLDMIDAGSRNIWCNGVSHMDNDVNKRQNSCIMW